MPAKKKSDPCWSGYKKQGMKTSKKTGKKVPNCVFVKKRSKK